MTNNRPYCGTCPKGCGVLFSSSGFGQDSRIRAISSIKSNNSFSYNCVQLDNLVLSGTGLVLGIGAFLMGRDGRMALEDYMNEQVYIGFM